MKTIRMVCLCVGSALALSCVAATTASAEVEYPLTGLPEIGRCVRLPKKTGQFEGKHCTKVSTEHKGSFEWKPGPGAKPKFKETLPNPLFKPAVESLETTCTTAVLEGEYTSGKTVKINSGKMTGCKEFLKKCQTLPTEPEVITFSGPLVGELGVVAGGTNPLNPHLGFDLKPESGKVWAEFTCGEFPSTLMNKLEGSVVARAAKTNGMYMTFEVSFQQKAGKQIPEELKGMPKDVLNEIIKPLNPQEPEKNQQIGLASIATIENSELMELKAK
jgi:hypothetical protein